MDLGLYMLKMPFRKLIGVLLPFFRNTNPNTISWALLPVGGLMAWVYFEAITTGRSWLFLVAALLGFVRMIIATLDGLVAVTYHKSSAVGDLVNRVTPELCDMVLIPTLMYASGNFNILGVGALTMAWATSFFGLLGVPSGCPVQSVGPVGQTDRLAALMLFSGLQFFGDFLGWQIDFIRWFFYWLIIGGCITLVLRFYRHFKAATALDSHGRK